LGLDTDMFGGGGVQGYSCAPKGMKKRGTGFTASVRSLV